MRMTRLSSFPLLNTAALNMVAGVPQHIRSDNGPEFVAKAIQRWLRQLNVEALHIEPGSPWENGYAESFLAAASTASSWPWKSSGV
jgi:transposase InsO family protein